jgi:hypothetical protein
MQMEQVRHHSCSLTPNWFNVSLLVSDSESEILLLILIMFMIMDY